jgi:hypothetical protein
MTYIGMDTYGVPITFSNEEHLFASLIILISVLSYLFGYYFTRVIVSKRASLISISVISRKKFLLFTFFYSFIGISASSFFLLHVAVNPDSGSLYFWLPLTLIVTVSAIMSVIVVFDPGYSKFVRLICLLVALFVVFTSNVYVMFVLYAFLYFYFHKNRLGLWSKKTPSRALLIGMVLLIPLVAFYSLFVKEVQRPVGVGSPFSLERITASETYDSVLHRFATLDIFNVETYSFIMHALRIYDFENLLLGKSFLVFVPVLKLVDDSIRGAGRHLAIAILGDETTVGFAVPPIIEFAINFSILSVPLFYAFLGMICRVAYFKYKNKQRSTMYMIFYAIFLPWLFILQRGDFLTSTVFPLYFSLILLVTLKICSLRVKHRCFKSSNNLT